jgi:Mg2+/Co2+ transporter CorC
MCAEQRSMSIENRKTRRRTVQHPAIVLDSNGSLSCLCTVKDVSATGAKLVLLEQNEIPDEFTLLLSKYGNVRRRCKISWRSATEIGVRFVFTGDDRGRG